MIWTKYISDFMSIILYNFINFTQKRAAFTNKCNNYTSLFYVRRLRVDSLPNFPMYFPVRESNFRQWSFTLLANESAN
jgi:hypothetical protein